MGIDPTPGIVGPGREELSDIRQSEYHGIWEVMTATASWIEGDG